ncbi:flagellar hook-basal body complex protein FliE [Chitinasiproducens palmae]|uniref:Flagellar hook-basal body complex protein FliE n=2 Tax=Chitinasiproducens palmae TaxID=1770053 RepID=A0A1H2PKG2_9BURK|nr:flagellar hook-basal body complex protein FliE [Chitinasiproducens palmae]
MTASFESMRVAGSASAPYSVQAVSASIDGAQAKSSFGTYLDDALHAIDARQHAAAARMQEVDSGRSDDLVGAMLASQDATLSFAMLTQVRNKVVAALDDLLKMPV